MNELKLNETGTLHGKLVKCVKFIPGKVNCDLCAFNETDECSDVNCYDFDHSSGHDVIYLAVEK